MTPQLHTNQSPINTCPICGHGKLYACTKGWKCDNTKCNYILHSKKFGTTLNEEDARRLTSGWATACKELINLKGRKYYARLKMNTSGQLSLTPTRSQSVSQKCPACQGTIRENNKCYYCEHTGTDICNFIVWKKWHGHQLTHQELHLLVTNRSTPLYTDFKDKLGKRYAARIILDDQNKPVLHKSDKSTKDNLSTI